MAEQSDPTSAQTGDDRDTLVEIARLIAAKEPPKNGGAAACATDASETDAARYNDFDRASARGESEILIRLLDILPAGVALCRDGSLLRANTSFALAFGYRSGEALVSQGGLSAILPALAEGQAATEVATGRPAQLMATARSRSGRSFEVPLSLLPVTADGTVNLLVLHPRPPREAGASASHASTLFSLADALGDGVTLLDERAHIIGLSDNAKAAFNAIKAADWRPGASFEALLMPSERPDFATAIERLRKPQAEAQTERLTIALQREAAAPLQAELVLGRMSEEAEASFWVALRQQTPEPTLPATSTAGIPDAILPTEPTPPGQASPRLKADFLAKVSHEVRTPLNSIIGFAELMLEERFGRLLNAKYREYIQNIHESGTYALSLINDLLDISKIESGKFELNFTAVDANEVIAETVQVMQPQARTSRVVLRSALGENVPLVLADRRSLKQMLLNLLSNAVKFTPPGGQAIVSSTFEPHGDVRIRVRDTGVGMTQGEIVQALEPFRQLDTAPRQQAGTGLGLPLTKALAVAHRAQFKIESEAKAGTQIDIVFPRNRVVA